MCSVAGWSGKLPIGFLSALLVEMGVRGRDSTGVAFRTQKGEGRHTLGYKMAVTPKEFVRVAQEELKEARKSGAGILHTRRASPGMPVDDNNAHPYAWENFVYAHNGRIENWKTLKDDLLAETEGDVHKRVEGFSTDSMVIGPCIEAMMFSELQGSMAIVWVEKEKVRAVTSAKELIAARVKCEWVSCQGVTSGGLIGKPMVREFSVFCSTKEILSKALAQEKAFKQYKNKVAVSMEVTELESGSVFELDDSPQGFHVVQEVAMHPENAADQFSSCAV